MEVFDLNGVLEFRFVEFEGFLAGKEIENAPSRNHLGGQPEQGIRGAVCPLEPPFLVEGKQHFGKPVHEVLIPQLRGNHLVDRRVVLAGNDARYCRNHQEQHYAYCHIGNPRVVRHCIVIQRVHVVGGVTDCRHDAAEQRQAQFVVKRRKNNGDVIHAEQRASERHRRHAHKRIRPQHGCHDGHIQSNQDKRGIGVQPSPAVSGKVESAAGEQNEHGNHLHCERVHRQFIEGITVESKKRVPNCYPKPDPRAPPLRLDLGHQNRLSFPEKVLLGFKGHLSTPRLRACATHAKAGHGNFPRSNYIGCACLRIRRF